jgi:hypothetical protein
MHNALLAMSDFGAKSARMSGRLLKASPRRSSLVSVGAGGPVSGGKATEQATVERTADEAANAAVIEALPRVARGVGSERE